MSNPIKTLLADLGWPIPDMDGKGSVSWQRPSHPVDLDNPFAKRWLVYADTTQAPAVQNAWKSFFQNPVVQEAYEKITPSSPAPKETTQLSPITQSFAEAARAFRERKQDGLATGASASPARIKI